MCSEKGIGLISFRVITNLNNNMVSDLNYAIRCTYNCTRRDHCKSRHYCNVKRADRDGVSRRHSF
jgi:hypothetical protein